MKGKKTGGRKKGTPNQATVKAQALLEHAAKGGMTPLEYLLGIMRSPMPPEIAAILADVLGEDGVIQDEKVMKAYSSVTGWHAARLDAAKAAAPYVHPKLQPVDKDGSSDVGIRHKLILEFIG
jgi:hypothetical protein